MLNKTQLLFLVILIEGYVVLACELLAIRELIPFVGSGTDVISIIISAVLMPLAIGYHWGGIAYRRSWKKKKLSIRKILLRNILSALILLGLGLSYIVMANVFTLMVMAGITHRLVQTTLYVGIFLVWPVFLLGQTVPLVSNYFSRRRLSEITGRMLFFSTLGSFLGSVFSTIILMTYLGVHYTVIITIGLLCVLLFMLSIRKMIYEPVMSVGIFLLVYFLNNGDIMGQMGIVSNNAYNMVRMEDVPQDQAKIMNINNSNSSKISKDPKNDFPYVRYIRGVFLEPLAASKKPHDILVVGAGGFTMGLHDNVNNYTYVDIDPDLKRISEMHFLPEPLGKNKQFKAASARAFVHSERNRYDLVIIDVYTNIYSIPMEVTTREFLIDVKKLLKDDGVVVANVISDPALRDKFSVRYRNTFASVFPGYQSQVIGQYNPWPGAHRVDGSPQVNNVLYVYYNHPLTGDTGVYTDDKNTYSLDRD